MSLSILRCCKCKCFVSADLTGYPHQAQHAIACSQVYDWGACGGELAIMPEALQDALWAAYRFGGTEATEAMLDEVP